MIYFSKYKADPIVSNMKSLLAVTFPTAIEMKEKREKIKSKKLVVT